RAGRADRGGGAGAAGQGRARAGPVGQGPQGVRPPLRRPAQAQVPAPALHELPAVAEMEELIAGPLAEALEAGRARFNAQFAQARRTLRALDPSAFADFLRGVVGPVVAEVARAAPDRVGPVVEVLYEFALELVGRELPRRFPVLAEGWKALLGGLPRYLAEA